VFPLFVPESNLPNAVTLIHLTTPRIVLLIVVIGMFSGFISGVFFQRQIGIGNLLDRLGLRHNRLLHHELSPRFQSLRSRPIPEGSIVFVGDSLVDLQEWNEVFPEINAVNRGVSGATLHDLTNAFEYGGARAVFCLIGANDIGRGTCTKEFSKRYERLIDSVDRNCAFHTVAIPSFFSYGGVPLEPKSIHEYNVIIRRLTESKDFTFIDTGTSTEWKREDFEGDGLHLSAAGYRKLAAYLKPHLENVHNKPQH
jgi:lysophospholipase L1-like esterase